MTLSLVLQFPEGIRMIEPLGGFPPLGHRKTGEEANTWRFLFLFYFICF